MELHLRGRVVMVAAASRGLGLGVARELAREGARVSLASRRGEEAEGAAATLRETLGAEVFGFPMDARDGRAIVRWHEEVLARWGQVDGLVVNAGGPPPGGFSQFGDEDWEAAFHLTLMSAVRLVRVVLPGMRARRRGAILAITSTTVREPQPNLLLSNVMRAGVTALVKSLSMELAAEGIRVNSLMPARIYTDRIQELDRAAAQRSGRPVEEVRRESEGRIPLGRSGEVEEFGRAGAFLLSDAASYITGVSLAVDGGALRGV